MPIYKDKKVVPSKLEPDYTPIRPDPGVRPDGGFKGSIVDARKRNVRTLLKYADGKKWSIIYYRQLLGVDSEPASYQPNQHTAYQQYEKIINYPIRVDSDLSTNQDNSTLQMTVTGSGTLFDGIVPNIGDVFIADSGNGRESLFTVNQFERRTILLDSCYFINYTLTGYIDNDHRTELDNRVVRELYYNDDYVGSGRGPLLTENEINSYRRIMSILPDIAQYYYQEFIDKDTLLFLVPDSDKRIYDPYIANAIRNTMPLDDCIVANFPRLSTIDNDIERRPTIWNNLISGTKQGLVRPYWTGRIDSSARYQTELIYSGIFIEKINNIFIIEERDLPVPTMVEPHTETSIHRVDLESTYILSVYFYTKNRERMSVIERMIDDYLNDKKLDPDILMTLYTLSHYWRPIDQYYYLPILYILFVAFLRD